MSSPSALRDAATDLLLGGTCLGCAAPGRLVCTACHSRLPTTAHLRRPCPPPPGLVASYSVAPYDGLVRAMVLAHKEQRLLTLTPVLGHLLAVSVATALADGGARGPVVLVPVPSRAATVRARGHDPMLAMTREAATALGRGASVASVLRSRPGVVDQAGLDAEARRANLTGSMATRTRALRSLARRDTPVHVVICDDVLTTGSTVREAQRALASVSVPAHAVATVAATVRRSAGRRVLGDSSGPEVPPHPPTH